MSSNYVYAIVNKVNLKLYFGSHSWDGEGLDPNYYGSGKIIKQAIKKYGKDNFIVYPVKFYDTIEECRKAEEELLTKHNIANNIYCYNLKNSAIGSEKGCKLSEEHRKKLSKAMTGERHRLYGKHHKDETRKKLSQAQNYKKTPLVAIQIATGKVKIFTSQSECSRVLGLNQGHINKCLKGRLKTTGGYSFKYVEELESGIYEGMQ